MKRIVRNSAKCKECRDEIESKEVHDFVRCRCGAIAVDGGKEYIRRLGDPKKMIETSIFAKPDSADDGPEVDLIRRERRNTWAEENRTAGVGAAFPPDPEPEVLILGPEDSKVVVDALLHPPAPSNAMADAISRSVFHEDPPFVFPDRPAAKSSTSVAAKNSVCGTCGCLLNKSRRKNCGCVCHKAAS